MTQLLSAAPAHDNVAITLSLATDAVANADVTMAMPALCDDLHVAAALPTAPPTPPLSAPPSAATSPMHPPLPPPAAALASASKPASLRIDTLAAGPAVLGLHNAAMAPPPTPTRLVASHAGRGHLTTTLDGTILLANHRFCHLAGVIGAHAASPMQSLPPGAPAVVAAAAALVGTPALDWLVPEHRAKMSKKLAAARDAVAAMDAAGVTERVVACGRVVRLKRPDGSTVPVSLWVKVKFPLPGTPASVLPTTGLQSPTTAIDGVLRDHRERFHADMVRAESISAATRAAAYKKPAPVPAVAVPRAGPCLVWVMEEVQQMVLTCTVRARDGGITRLEGPWSDVFGGGAVDENTPLSRVVPGLLEFERTETPGSVDFAAVRAARRKYFTTQTAAGVVAPLILRLDPLDTAMSRFDDPGPCYSAQLFVMPHLAGLVTVDAHGRVVACSPVFCRYLLSRSAKTLLGRPASELIPAFDTVMAHARNHAAAADASPVTRVPRVELVHSDGARLVCDVQVRALAPLLGDAAPAVATHSLWITFDLAAAAAPPAREEEKEEAAPVFPPVGIIAPLVPTFDARIPVPLPGQPPFSLKVRKSLADYADAESLGEGAYGQVKLVRDIRSGARRVLKLIAKDRIPVSSWTKVRPYSLVPTEIAVLDLVARTHPHPNIARMVAFWEDEAVYGVEMALPDDGGDTQMDLFDYVELHTSMAEREVQYIFRSVCAAVAHLHSLNVVHRDIKDENVVLSMTNRSVLHVELIDFGSAAYARSAAPTMDVFCGTVEYCPPEIALGRKYQGKPQDVWSLGVLLYVLLYKEAPFANFDEIVAKEVRVPYVVSPGSVDLLLRMLNKDPAARPTMDAVLAHPWLAAASPLVAASAAPAAGNN
ncbi:hypothetical protein GGF31_000827 [Allomyces arbusculus]|nr:hypothetical protein GGF31_000827 [Allomyces arbusculus]